MNGFMVKGLAMLKALVLDKTCQFCFIGLSRICCYLQPLEKIISLNVICKSSRRLYVKSRLYVSCVWGAQPYLVHL